jgi:hypothetical protein
MADKYRVEPTVIHPVDKKTGEATPKWRVYYWCERPDAAVHVEADKFHWHLVAEFDTEQEAKAHMAALKKTGRRSPHK